MYEVIGMQKTRTLRVLWALEELEQPYRLTEAAPRSEVITAANPLGKVPALRHGDATLTDSLAIITYLADRHSALTATAGTIARARQDALTNYIIDEMDAVLWTSAKHSFVLPQDKRVEGLQPTYAWEYARAVTHLEQRLRDQPFLCGDSFTIPDILATHCANWAGSLKIMPDTKVFGAYLDRMRARPAYARAVAARMPA